LFGECLSALKEEYNRRQGPEENNKGATTKSTAGAKTASAEFEKITLQWLIRHMPVKILLILISFVLGSFTLGIKAGQLEMVKQYFGTSTIITPSTTQ